MGALLWKEQTRSRWRRACRSLGLAVSLLLGVLKPARATPAPCRKGAKLRKHTTPHNKMPKTVASCLTKLGLTDLSVFDACDSLAEEWSAIKRAYFKTALETRLMPSSAVQSAFDKLRALFDTAGPQFLFSASATKATSDEPGHAL